MQKSDGTNLLASTFRALERGDRERVDTNLALIPLSNLSSESFYDLLYRFLSITVRYNYPEIAARLIEVFEESTLLSEKIPLFTSLFLHYIFLNDPNMLRFLIKALPEYSLYEHLSNLIEYDEGPMIPMAAGTLIQLYRPILYEDYVRLGEVAKSMSSTLMLEIINAKIEELAPKVPKPEWVNTEIGPGDQSRIPTEIEVMTSIPRDYQFELPLPNDEDAINMLLNNLELTGELELDPEESRRIITSQVASMSRPERLELFRPILAAEANYDLGNDRLLYRALGPVNASMTGTSGGDSICDRYGGCRMFTCVDAEAIDPEDDTVDPDPDWFTGNCQQCLHQIENRYWAVRNPLLSGSWKGCFCSWECVRDFAIIPPCGPDVEVCPVESSDSINRITEMILTRVASDMNRIGIQDRIPEGLTPGDLSRVIDNTYEPPREEEDDD